MGSFTWIQEQLAPGEYGYPKGWTEACPASANTQAVAAQADELDRSWRPTGFYSADEMREMVGAIMVAANAQHNAVMTAQESFSITPLRDAQEAYNEIGKRAADYTEIWRKALASGVVIDAPGFRQWVIDALRTMNRGMRAVEIASCAKPWWLSAIQVYMHYFTKAVNVAKRIGAIVVAAGQTVLDAAEGVFKAWRVVKWGLLGVGLLFVGIAIRGYARGYSKRIERKFQGAR